MIVILFCHGYRRIVVVRAQTEVGGGEDNAAGKRSFFRVSRCNFNKSWISGRRGVGRGEGVEQLANSVHRRPRVPTGRQCIELIYRRAIVYT